MRRIPLVLFVAMLALTSALASSSDSAAAPTAAPARTTALSGSSSPFDGLMQEIARRADPLDTEDLRQIEKRARAGSRDDQLTMGCLLSLGSAAQVTSPQVPTANPTKAAEYFEMAAHSGSPEAQFLLGIMKLRGNGIPADRIKGAMWINVASAAKLKLATKEAGRLKADLSSDELAQAQRLANQWLGQHASEIVSRASAE